MNGLIGLALLALVSADARELTANEELNRQSVNALREGLQDRYQWRDAREIDWEATLVPARSSLIAASDSADFAAQASVLLGAARNPHLVVRSAERSWSSFTVLVDPGINLESARGRIPGLQSISPSVAWAQYSDGVGYVLVSDLNDEDALHQAMMWLQGARGIVLDVRGCRTGDEDHARALAAYFLTEPAIYARHRERPQGAPPGVTNEQSREVRSRSDVRFEGPAAVLQSGANMGACESFLLMMQHSKQSTRLGQTSYGSSEPTAPLTLPNGVIVDVPKWQAMDASGAVLEGVGVAPDTEVSPADGADPALDAALKWVRAWKTY